MLGSPVATGTTSWYGGAPGQRPLISTRIPIDGGINAGIIPGGVVGENISLYKELFVHLQQNPLWNKSLNQAKSIDYVT